jgi:DNA-binding response OmpR family regulator
LSVEQRPAYTAGVGGFVPKTIEANGVRSSVAPQSVLIVDDNAPTANALAALLLGAGFEPIVFVTGAAALDFAQATGADAAVVDIHLPDINGLVLSQKLRQSFGPNAPIIVLSADSSMETLNSLPHVGATHFFSKPVNSGQLVERLRETVGPRK